MSSVGTKPSQTDDYTDGHFTGEYPENYIISAHNAETMGESEPIIGGAAAGTFAPGFGRSLSQATTADAEGALLEAAKAAQSTPDLADLGALEEIGTPALMTEV